MSIISNNLQTIVDNFVGTNLLGPDVAANLRACIESSPALAEQMNLAVATGRLKGFAPMEQGDPSAGALYLSDKQTIKIPPQALVSTPDKPFNIHDMAFVLGHETQHGFNAAERARTVATAFKEMRRIARSPTDDSYDVPAAAWQQAARTDEAKASLAGWNAAVSQLRHEGAEVTLESMYTRYKGRASDFVDETEIGPGQFRYAAKPGITLKDDLSLDVNDPANVAALGQYYYDNPDRRVGHARSTYANYTGATIIHHAIGHERHYRSDRMTIDLARHGMSEPDLERNGIDLGRRLGPQPRHRYVDTSHGQAREGYFDHTSDARVSAEQRYRHVPVAPALHGPRERGFDDRDHPQHALYDALRRRLPPETSEDRLAQITLAAARGGVQPGQMHVAASADAVFVFGTVPGQRATIDLRTPPPPVRDTLQQAEARERQQAQWREQQQIGARVQQDSMPGR